MCPLYSQTDGPLRLCIFRRRLEVPSVSDAVTLGGKVFQTRGAATKNARSPIVVRHEDGVTRADVDEDRSLFILYPRPPHDVARSPGTAKDENREFKLYPG